MNYTTIICVTYHSVLALVMSYCDRLMLTRPISVRSLENIPVEFLTAISRVLVGTSDNGTDQSNLQ